MGREKEKLNIPVMIFCIVGIVLTVLGFMLERDRSFKLNVISATGTVTGVNTSTDADGKVTSVTVVLAYRANKSDYTATINSPDNKMKIGDKMNLYYDFFDPTSVSEKRTGYQGYLCLVIGVILVLKTGPRFYRIIRDNYL